MAVKHEQLSLDTQAGKVTYLDITLQLWHSGWSMRHHDSSYDVFSNF